jgi:hypothetical protein
MRPTATPAHQQCTQAAAVAVPTVAVGRPAKDTAASLYTVDVALTT